MGAGSSVEVRGNVSGKRAVGACVYMGGTIKVGGNITVSGEGNTGAYAWGGGEITVDGTITATIYIMVDGEEKAPKDGVPGSDPYEDYLIYSGSTSTVRVRIFPASITPDTVSFDLDAPEDITTAITWNDATTVTEVVYGSTALVENEDFDIEDDDLTIYKNCILDMDLTEGESVVFEISFDMGNSATLTVNIVRTYTVTFDSNGGSEVDSQTVQTGNTAAMPDAPTRTGYRFAGWYSDEDLTAEFNFTTPITADIALYAKMDIVRRQRQQNHYPEKIHHHRRGGYPAGTEQRLL